MSYVKSTSTQTIDPSVIEAMARLIGLPVPLEEVPALAATVRDQLASIQSLDDLDLTGIMPALEFDPRWDS